MDWDQFTKDNVTVATAPEPKSEPAEDAVKPEPEVQPAEQAEEKTVAPEAKAETAETDQAKPEEQEKDAGGEEKTPKKNRAERRWDKLIEERGYYRAKAEQLEQFMRQQTAAPKPETTSYQPDSNVPKRDQFKDEDEWANAVISYHVRKQVEQQTQQAQVSHAVSDYQRKIAEGKVHYDDFDEKVQQANQTNPLFTTRNYPHVEAAVMDSDLAADLTYFLAANPQESEKITQMPPHQAVKYIGKLEGLIEKAFLEEDKTKPKVSKAPPPYSTPVGQSKRPEGKRNLFTPGLSTAEFQKYWKEVVG